MSLKTETSVLVVIKCLNNIVFAAGNNSLNIIYFKGKIVPCMVNKFATSCAEDCGEVQREINTWRYAAVLMIMNLLNFFIFQINIKKNMGLLYFYRYFYKVDNFF